MREGFTRRGPDWRAWIAVLAVALIGFASVTAVSHGPHEDDHDCTICLLVQQVVADLGGALTPGPAATPEPGASPAVPWWTPTEPASQIPARAPPA